MATPGHAPASVDELEELLSRPPPTVCAALGRLEGDLVVLGAGGKVGPSLARMARRALDEIDPARRVFAVSRFSDAEERTRLERHGVETAAVDLLEGGAFEELPDAPNVLYLVGRKFGTSGAEHLTWAINAAVVARAQHWLSGRRVVAFSTGNVYPLVPVGGGGATEETRLDPIGEYAQSCLARERMFDDASLRLDVRVLHFRLNYAIDLRYGVLLEVARAVRDGRPVDLAMGAVNVIWQGDVNAYALRSLEHAASPPRALNVSGPETVSVRWLAERFGHRLGVDPVLEGEERETALLTNASASHALFGYPTVSLGQLVEWTADWVEADRPTLAKPTHFQERAGAF
jgi:nucleoside-diphosphate-sugar epimerase